MLVCFYSVTIEWMPGTPSKRSVPFRPMTDETWTDADDALRRSASVHPDSPSYSARVFANALRSPIKNSGLLAWLVTPESRASWGNFEKAATLLRSIKNPGIGSNATPAFDAPDVAYVKIMADVTEAFTLDEPSFGTESAIVSLVWRPEHGRWLVHGFGAYSKPTELTRTSPGSAPQY